MKQNHFLIIFFFVLFSFFYIFNVSFAASSSDSVNINLTINNCNNDNICDFPDEDFASCPADCPAACNNNNICEANLGEDINNCPNDCTPPPVCNNNSICEIGEDILNCPADCVILPPICNMNNICESGETIANCPSDCSIIPPVCNMNSVCESGETIANCPFDCSITPPTPTAIISSGSILGGNFIKNLTIEVSYSTAIIRWNSSFPTKSELKWGNNFDYKDGTISDIELSLNHKLEITNLKEGATYYFKIQSEDYFGRIYNLSNQFFTTLSSVDTTPPSNPTNVRASSSDAGITVYWQNPDEEDFDYIRVMKNFNRFYGSPLEGVLVYEGKGSYFTDSKVKIDNRYYYSLFSRDFKGNYSSGSLISTVYNPTGEDTWGRELIQEPKLENLGDLYFITQDSSIYDFKMGDTVVLNGDAQSRIKTNHTSSNLKNDDLWIELINSDREVVNKYFFSRVKDKDGFLNIELPPFGEGGYYGVSVYRYHNGEPQLVHQGGLQVNKVREVKSNDWIIFLIIFILFFLIILLIIYHFTRKFFLIIFGKSKKKEENQN